MWNKLFENERNETNKQTNKQKINDKGKIIEINQTKLRINITVIRLYKSLFICSVYAIDNDRQQKQINKQYIYFKSLVV